MSSTRPNIFAERFSRERSGLRPAIVLVHGREGLYRQPRDFTPERFLDDEAISYSWLPFGGGIRRCIGAALAQAETAEVLRVAETNVELRPLRAARDPVVLRGITLAPKHGVRVTVERNAQPEATTSSTSPTPSSSAPSHRRTSP